MANLKRLICKRFGGSYENLLFYFVTTRPLKYLFSSSLFFKQKGTSSFLSYFLIALIIYLLTRNYFTSTIESPNPPNPQNIYIHQGNLLINH